MIIVVGRAKSHGVAFLRKTKSDDYLNGLVWEFISKAKKADTPSDASTVIKLEAKLDKFQLKGVRDFYNYVVGVMDKFEVTKWNCKLCILMACKNPEASYAQLILELK